MVKTNKVSQRLVYFSPTVQAGWEDESNIEDFEVSKILGKGAFGQVVKGTQKTTKLTYALKKIDRQNLIDSNMTEQIINEVKIMYSLNHKHILKLYNHFEEEKNITLVLEFAAGGQLYQKLWQQKNKRFNEKVAATYIMQLCLALQYTHSKGIIHRDIKPENILMDVNGSLKLADFGWSNFFMPNSKDLRETFCGTLDYIAPEMLEKKHKHDHNVDIWAVGVLTYELLTGMAPFSPRVNQNNQNYVDVKTKENIKNCNFKFPSDFPQQAQDLVQKILIADPQKRLTLQQIIEHPWIIQQCGDEHLKGMQMQKKTIDESNFKYNETEKNKDHAFTKEQIYKYSINDSVINKPFDKANLYHPAYNGQKETQQSTQETSNQQIAYLMKTIEQLKQDKSHLQQVSEQKNNEITKLQTSNGVEPGTDLKLKQNLDQSQRNYLELKAMYEKQNIQLQQTQKSLIASQQDKIDTQDLHEKIAKFEIKKIEWKSQIDAQNSEIQRLKVTQQQLQLELNQYKQIS